jgi:hypothetical protein
MAIPILSNIQDIKLSAFCTEVDRRTGAKMATAIIKDDCYRITLYNSLLQFEYTTAAPMLEILWLGREEFTTERCN